MLEAEYLNEQHKQRFRFSISHGINFLSIMILIDASNSWTFSAFSRMESFLFINTYIY